MRQVLPSSNMTIRCQLLLLLAAAATTTTGSVPTPTKRILVVGSINMDTIIDVERLPVSGETVTSLPDTGVTVPGGKGANQAVAVARLCAGADGGSCTAQFACQLGSDAHAKVLEQTLVGASVDISASMHVDKPSGQGLVFLLQDGTVSSVVVPGANAAWPQTLPQDLEDQVVGAAAVLLQREVPEHVNDLVAQIAYQAGVPVLQDVGGEERAMSDLHLSRVAVVAPNLSELQRLTGMAVDTEAAVEAAARALQARGARMVLVTRGGRGALLLDDAGTALSQPAAEVPGGAVVDETAAGDAFRAAFAVGLVAGRSLPECLRFAAAAGAIAVSRRGAEPALPTRAEVERHLSGLPLHAPREQEEPAGAGCGAASAGEGECAAAQALPLPMFASRLNSMGARMDLWEEGRGGGVAAWIARQGGVRGLQLVDLNYPQHFPGSAEAAAAGPWQEELEDAAAAAGLRVGAVNLRFPAQFGRGAFSSPSEELRARAVALTVEAGDWALRLGAAEVVVWSAFDGYDYHLQADYSAAWARTVRSFQEVCDAHPTLKVMVEYKPTDENTRYAVVGSAGAAKLLVQEVARPNMGVMIDVGHCLMAGENPAQSVALLGDRLFGVHLNDGHSRLGAEDGLAFASVHAPMALELMYWLQRVGYKGHLYMDTFPRNEDPVREAEFNIRRAAALWARAQGLRAAGLDFALTAHDAMAALELMELHP